MSTPSNDAFAPGVCLVCGAAPGAVELLPDRFTTLQELAPRFAQRLRSAGWIDVSVYPPAEVSRGPSERARLLCPHRYAGEFLDYVRALESRLGERPQETQPEDRRELLGLVSQAGLIRGGAGTAWEPSQNTLAEAVYELALLRRRLPTLKSLSGRDLDSLLDASGVLKLQGDPWRLVRPLLQLLRAAPVPTLASDLRYWRDGHVSEWPLGGDASEDDRALAKDAVEDMKRLENAWEDWAPGNAGMPTSFLGAEPLPPEGWRAIPAELAYSLHQIATAAQIHDPELVEFRATFSRHLLDCLKPDKDSKAHEPGKPHKKRWEPKPQWRVGCLRAVEALRINPQGTGHRTVHAVAQHDPSAEVRDEAARIYPLIRNAGSLRESPRRAILHAIWELFRAHMLVLQPSIDEAGAERVKREMIRRTTRPDEEVSK